MIADSQSIKYELSGENLKGIFKVSKFVKSLSDYKFPFNYVDEKTLIKIGSGDYNDFDSFIISSLNDYYNSLSLPTDLDTKENMLEEYKKLYLVWSQICDAKQNDDIVKLKELYQIISYGLLQLGYEDKGL